MNTSDFDLYPYCGIPTFLRSSYGDVNMTSMLDYKVGVMGVPFDEGCPYKAGQRFCARSIREQSLRIGPLGVYNTKEKRMYLNNLIQSNSIIDFGDVNIIPTDVVGSLKRTTEMAKKIISDNRFLLALGGDHTVTFPLVRAFEDQDINVIYLDAHYDDLPLSEDFQYTNGHALSHIIKMENVKQIIHIGGRTMRDMPFYVADSEKCHVINMEDYLKKKTDALDEVIDLKAKYYVSIDIDALDSSIIPGCVSGEPGGFSFNELNELLCHIAENANVIGFDMVEIAPDLDVKTNITSYIGMLLVTNFLGRIFEDR